MKVTVVCDVLGEENNGTTIAAMNLIRSLKAKGHEVNVICSDKNRASIPGFYIVPTYNLGIFNNYVAKNGVALARPDMNVMESAIKGADVIHIMIPFSLARAALIIAQKYNIPVTAGFHCQAENLTNHLFMMNFGLANYITYHYFYHSVYRHCDCIHYPSKFICDTFENEVGPTNHYIISNGVSGSFVPKIVPKPDEYKDKFVILFTGRYSKEKSHKVLLDAVSHSKYNRDIQLIFAGAGPLREKLIARAKKLDINMPVFQFFSHDELMDTINYADLYVHPAEIELEGIACLEALVCGKVPVVSDSKRCATKNFALSEHNLFKCNDSEDLAAKIDFWIEHPKEREQCGREYLGYVKNFDFETCMDNMEKMLFDAIKGRQNGENTVLYGSAE